MTTFGSVNDTTEVACHVCGRDLRSSDAVTHGDPEFGARHHCAQHADCDTCSHGDWCSDTCTRERTGGVRILGPVS